MHLPPHIYAHTSAEREGWGEPQTDRSVGKVFVVSVMTDKFR